MRQSPRRPPTFQDMYEELQSLRGEVTSLAEQVERLRQATNITGEIAERVKTATVTLAEVNQKLNGTLKTFFLTGSSGN